MNRFLCFAIIAVIVLPLSAHAFELPPKETFHNGLSLQGFTGNLNTPNAYVTREGDIYFQYSNQKESRWRDRTPYQDNYLFSVGAFGVAEVGGRLTWAPAVGAQDLSGNLKLTTEPFFRKYPVPVLAVGMEDVSGGAPFFRTKYAVLSDEISRLRLSVGYGTGPERMKGLFGGGELKAHDWFYLLADYDTRETNVGARLVLPHFWKIPISFTATAKSSINHKPGNVDIALGFSLPLDFNVRSEGNQGEGGRLKVEGEKAVQGSREEKAAQDSGLEVRGLIPETQYPVWSSENAPIQNPKSKIQNSDSLESLRTRLVRAGFMNVRVGDVAGKTAVVEFENVTFNHNEMDALGVVAGMTVEALKGGEFETLRFVIKKKNIRLMQLTVPVSPLAGYLENGRNVYDLKGNMTISGKCDGDRDVSFVQGDENSSFLTTSLMLSPGLKTWIGTDYGAFDYILSIKPELFVNLWKGGLINARWDIPVIWSDNLDKFKPLWSLGYRTPTRMERLIFSQGIKIAPGIMANLGGGKITPDVNGTVNELVWSPGDGAHRLKLSQSWGQYNTTHKKNDTYLAAYRFYFSPLDLSLEGTAGKFWSQDKGYLVELKRMFGDTAFSVYYKNSSNPDSANWLGISHWQSAGVIFSFPLTPEKDMKHYYNMQLRGSNEWSYGQETVIASSNGDNANYLPPLPILSVPRLATSLDSQYLNRDRLSESYIKSHLERLRESWIKYRDALK